ncbi:MAG: hypothetical protein ACQESR_14330 [Planctomycetota bacterium]
MDSGRRPAGCPRASSNSDRPRRSYFGSRLQTFIKFAARGDILQAVGFVAVESCPTQAVLRLVGLAADKVIRDWYKLR